MNQHETSQSQNFATHINLTRTVKKSGPCPTLKIVEKRNREKELSAVMTRETLNRGCTNHFSTKVSAPAMYVFELIA